MASGPTRFGAYWLLKSLGGGAMGDVHIATPAHEDSGLPKALVVKRLRGEFLRDESVVARFRHEAEVATQIDSPYVVRVYDTGSVDDVLYMAMELVPGCTLGRLVKEARRRGPMSVGNLLGLLRRCAEGLDALHNAKTSTGEPLELVHRDVSPRNVIVDPDQNPRLIDLGIGKSRLQDWRTSTGLIVGTPGYMPPEQAVGRRVDKRADLYALAVVMWELLTLERYITRGPVPTMLAACRDPEFVLPSIHRAETPVAVDRLFERALQVDPAARFQSARELIEAIDEIEAGQVDTEPDILSPMLRDEMADARTRVTDLVEGAPRTSEPPPAPTVVFSHHSSLKPHPEAHLVSSDARIVPPSKAPVRLAVAAVVGASACVLVAIALTREVGTSAPAPIRAPAPPPPAAVSATPREVETAPDVEPPVVTKSARPKRRRRPRVRRAVRTPPPPPPPVEPPPTRPRKRVAGHAELVERLRGYLVRARKLRSSADDSARPAIDRLITDLAQQRTSPRLTQEVARVDSLERRLLDAERRQR